MTMTLDELHAATAGKKVLYIIPCCDKKNMYSNYMLAPDEKIASDLFSKPNFNLWKQFYLARHAALGLHPVNPCVSPHGREFNPINPQAAYYLPAWERYNGLLYNVPNMKLLLQSQSPAYEILFQSPLWGLVSPHDHIQNYDLDMIPNYDLGRISNAAQIWSKNDLLSRVVDAFVTENNINMIVGLLTTKYAEILGGLANQKGCPSFMVTSLPHYNDKHAQKTILEGLGHALLYLAQGTQPPAGYTYKVGQVRP